MTRSPSQYAIDDLKAYSSTIRDVEALLGDVAYDALIHGERVKVETLEGEYLATVCEPWEHDGILYPSPAVLIQFDGARDKTTLHRKLVSRFSVLDHMADL